MSMTQPFPKDFYWGAATASYQVEGGIENCDWAAAARAGRVPVCGRACDHYHRYEADFDIAASLGHNAHRFSIEWARIEPTEGQFDMAAIDHYRQVLSALQARGIEPFVTLWHFTLPEWFAQSGGFLRPDAAALFARYAVFVVHQLGDLCRHFTTMNEPNVYATHAYLYGVWPPFRQASLLGKRIGKSDGTTAQARPTAAFRHFFEYLKVERQLIAAHRMAYKNCKAIAPSCVIGVVKHVHVFRAEDSWWYKVKARVAQYFQTHRFMSAIADTVDEIGLNYYRSTTFGDTKNYLQTDMGWYAQPSGVYDAIMVLGRYKKPIFIAEAGLADEDDDMRADYISVQIKAMAKAIADGADVRGHMYWSLLDNYEWALGFKKRFGLVAVDYDTLERTVRPSAYVYKDLIKHHQVLK